MVVNLFETLLVKTSVRSKTCAFTMWLSRKHSKKYYKANYITGTYDVMYKPLSSLKLVIFKLFLHFFSTARTSQGCTPPGMGFSPPPKLNETLIENGWMDELTTIWTSTQESFMSPLEVPTPWLWLTGWETRVVLCPPGFWGTFYEGLHQCQISSAQESYRRLWGLEEDHPHICLST